MNPKFFGIMTDFIIHALPQNAIMPYIYFNYIKL